MLAGRPEVGVGLLNRSKQNESGRRRCSGRRRKRRQRRRTRALRERASGIGVSVMVPSMTVGIVMMHRGRGVRATQNDFSSAINRLKHVADGD
jgi:hypothetical protein